MSTMFPADSTSICERSFIRSLTNILLRVAYWQVLFVYQNTDLRESYLPFTRPPLSFNVKKFKTYHVIGKTIIGNNKNGHIWAIHQANTLGYSSRTKYQKSTPPKWVNCSTKWKLELHLFLWGHTNVVLPPPEQGL